MDSDPVCNRVPQELQRNKEEMTDLFEVLLQCSEEPDSWCWLLAEAVKQRAPILSVLASCLQVGYEKPKLRTQREWKKWKGTGKTNHQRGSGVMMIGRLQCVFSRSLSLLCFSSLGTRPSITLPSTLMFSNRSGLSFGSWLEVLEKGPCFLSREVGYSRQSLDRCCGRQSCFLILSTSTTSGTHSISWSLDRLHSAEQFIVVPWLFISIYSMFGSFQARLTSVLRWLVQNRKHPSMIVALLGAPSSLCQVIQMQLFFFFWKVFILWQDASTIPCLCVWIVTSVEDTVAAEATEHIQGSMEEHIWDLQDLSVIWRTLLTRQKSKTLIRGFQLFFKVVIVTSFRSCV